MAGLTQILSSVRGENLALKTKLDDLTGDTLPDDVKLTADGGEKSTLQ